MLPRPVSRGGVVDSALRAWRKNTTGAAAASDADVTHRSLAGGNYVVDEPRRLITVMAVAARDQSGVHYLVERRTPIHPMIVDLDYAYSAVIGDDEWLRMVGALQSVMREFFPANPDATAAASAADEHLNAYVVIAPPDHVPHKQLDMGNGEKREFVGFVKSGLHIYWPGALVDMATALLVRMAFIQRLEQVLGYRQPTDSDNKQWPPWSTIVDECVLTANGLRMLFAHKAAKCGACVKKRGRTDAFAPQCEACQGKGMLDYGRPYVPHWVVDAAGVIDAGLTRRFREDQFYALTMTTVRSACSAMPIAPQTPEWVKQLHVEMPVRTTNNNKRQQQPNQQPDSDAVVHNNGSGYNKTISGHCYTFAQDDNRDGRLEERKRAIERFINDEAELAGPTMPQEVRRLLKADNGGQYYMAVGTNKYCHNVRRQHHNQDVYYILSAVSIWQCCWSRRQRDTDVNMVRDCRGYSSPHKPMSASLRDLLFNPHVNRSTIIAEDSWSRHKMVARYYLPVHDVEAQARYSMARALLPLLRAPNCEYRDSPLVKLMLQCEEAARVYTDILGLPRVD